MNSMEIRMSLALLQSEFDARAGSELVPNSLPTECLMSWCRLVEKHETGELNAADDDALFDILNAYIEKILLTQDCERVDLFRRNIGSFFGRLADEVDELVRAELISRIVGNRGIDIELTELFQTHFYYYTGFDRAFYEVDLTTRRSVRKHREAVSNEIPAPADDSAVDGGHDALWATLRAEKAQRRVRQIPDNFPRLPHEDGEPSAHHYLVPGCPAPELYGRWQECSQLVPQFVTSCIETKKGLRSNMSEAAILDQYQSRLIESQIVSRDEARWVIGEVARLLGWPSPTPLQTA